MMNLDVLDWVRPDKLSVGDKFFTEYTVNRAKKIRQKGHPNAMPQVYTCTALPRKQGAGFSIPVEESVLPINVMVVSITTR